jgi:glucokinase
MGSRDQIAAVRRGLSRWADMSDGPIVAADIGGTQMRAALVDRHGNVLLRRSAATPDDDAPAALITLVASVCDERAYGDPSHAVVALPGPVDYEAGTLLWAPNLPPGWPEQLSSQVLSERLGLPALVANDADVAAVGEAIFGAGTGHVDLAYLTVSTGIGAGVVHGGRLARGRQSLAEVGHTVIDVEAWRAGRPSTVEELGSGSGVARLAAEANLDALDARGVQAAAAEGDEAALAIWHEAIAACAAAVTNLAMFFSPEVVVIGGGLGRQDAFFYAVRTLVLARSEHLPAGLSVVRSALGDDAGLIGAAGWEQAFGPR